MRAPRADSSVRPVFKYRLRFPSQTSFGITVSLLWALLYNVTFWHSTARAMWYPHASSFLFFASLLIVMIAAHATLLLLVPTRPGLRIVASLLFVVSALSAYFSDTYGALMNGEMMRNVVQTDPAEVRGLVTAGLLIRLVFLGVLPAILVWWVAMPRTGFREELKQRAIFLGVAWLLAAVSMLAASASYAVFLREHKPLRSFAAPMAVVANSVGLLVARERTEYTGPLLHEGGVAHRLAPQGTKPLVLFLVIGETARAANFELGGYPRETNPRLKDEPDLVYFDHATSCGTSTATSVPCIFSPFGRATFNVDLADRYANLLDVLESAGIDVEWRDNNAGCKGVCKRVRAISYASRPDRALCPHSYCFDEVMLKDLPQRLGGVTRDTIIVFHQIGSHGPAYAERYPEASERFRPACRSNELHRCSSEQIVNAYDNSIAYTDSVLARQIDLLRDAAERLDGALIYASDHGESLGEGGVYLHGLPYSMAPGAQKEIPLLVWTSSGSRQRIGLDEECLKRQAHQPVSHDNLYHTVMGLFGVRNGAFDGKLDLLAACRREASKVKAR